MDRDEEAARNKALYALRRPQDFAPWEVEHPDGCKLFEAIYALTLPEWRKSVANFLADVEVGLLPESRPLMQDHFWRHILYRLQVGELVMRARPVGGDQVQDVPPEMLDDAKPDFVANKITCNGVTFGAVRVFDHFHTPIPTSERMETAETRAERWMRENVTRYVANQRDGRVTACRKALGIGKDAALHGWNSLDETIKGVPRTPKK